MGRQRGTRDNKGGDGGLKEGDIEGQAATCDKVVNDKEGVGGIRRARVQQ